MKASQTSVASDGEVSKAPEVLPTTEPTNAHKWVEQFGLTCCKQCGLVRRRDGTSNPCRGQVRVCLRSHSNIPNHTLKER